MSSDLPRLARALEYLDMASALYLAGGADHSAQLLAAAGERLLGDLARLIQSPEHGHEVQQLLAKLTQQHVASPVPEVGPTAIPRLEFSSYVAALLVSTPANPVAGSGWMTRWPGVGLPSCIRTLMSEISRRSKPVAARRSRI